MNQSTQQRNADAWLTLKAALDERHISYKTKSDYAGTLWVEFLDFNYYESCVAGIKIGPGVGVAQVQVIGIQSVPESYRAYVGRVLAQISHSCPLGSIKLHTGCGDIKVETPILFIDGNLRPQDVLYALGRMSYLFRSVIDEMWGVFDRRKSMKNVQETLQMCVYSMVEREADEWK